VAYISKSLNEAERNYKIHDKEMLAIIWCLEIWRHFLEGAKDWFEIWMDHKNLEYFIKAQKLNQRQTRWSLYLSVIRQECGQTLGLGFGQVYIIMIIISLQRKRDRR